MSTKNRRRFLKTAVASVRAQTYENWELIVVRDGGEPVADILEAFQDQRIRLIQFEKGGGKARAINQAFSVSKGEYIAHLDDDDIWYPKHLDRLLFFLSNVPGMRMAYSDGYNVTLAAKPDGTFEEINRELKYDYQVTLLEMIQDNYILGISVLHDRRLFREAGGMDEGLQVLIDFDLWRRFAAITYPYHVNQVTADAFQRKGEKLSPGTHITSLYESDPPKYMANRIKIMNKSLNLPPESHLRQALAYTRRGALFLYLGALAVISLEQQNYPACRRLLGHMEKLSNCSPILFNRLKGKFEMKTGNFTSALECFHYCMSIGGGHPNDWLNASKCCLKLNRIKEAETYRRQYEMRL